MRRFCPAEVASAAVPAEREDLSSEAKFTVNISCLLSSTHLNRTTVCPKCRGLLSEHAAEVCGKAKFVLKC